MRKELNTSGVYWVPAKYFGSSYEKYGFLMCTLFPYENGGFKYKVYMRPIIDPFHAVSMYTDDFISFVDKGIIVEETYENRYQVVKVEALEPIYGSLCVHHEYLTLVKV